jgi:predicted nicotinamide N-methyase
LLLVNYHNIALSCPNIEELQQRYQTQQISFPYWGKVWHSALALTDYIVENNSLLAQKKVYEIGAGLGLPSLVAANYAAHCTITDCSEVPLQYINNSINANAIKNATTQLYNWLTQTVPLFHDVYLLSDVNYNPTDFPMLLQLVQELVNQNKTVLLATPQRLMAKAFIASLLPLAKQQTEKEITINQQVEYISILRL